MVVVARNLPATRFWAQQLIGLAAAASLGPLFAAIILSYFMFVQAGAREQWVTHSLVVQRGTNELRSDMLQAESAQRGFIITGQDVFLGPYEASKSGFFAELAKLRDMTRDDRMQQSRLGDICNLAIQRFRTLDEIPERVRNGELKGPLGTVAIGPGKAIGDQLAQLVGEFRSDEDQLLAQRERAANRTRTITSGVIIVSIILSLVSAGFAISLVRTRLITLAANRDLLEANVVQRTAELEEAKRQAEREARRATKEQERVELLLRDLNHRVGNNLATISALLGLQLNRLGPGPARNAIESARNRIGAIGIAQRRLRLGEDLQTTRLDEFFESVLTDMLEALPNTGRFTLDRNFEPLLVGSRDAVTLSVVMNELITNAFKHAFPEGRAGKVTVSLTLDGGVAVLRVVDDGVGMPVDGAQDNDGLGAMVVERMSQQYGGSVTREQNTPSGMIVTITMPGLRTGRAAGPINEES